MRMSTHRFNIETGRYFNATARHSMPDKILWTKCCKVCCTDDGEYLTSLPLFDPILEDEQHVLATCPLYHHLRMGLPDEVKSSLISWEPERLTTIFNILDNVKPFATYIQKIFHLP